MFVGAWFEATRGHDVGVEYEPEPWPDSVMQFPLVGAIPGAIMAFLIIIKDGQGFIAKLREHGRLSVAWAHASEAAMLAPFFDPVAPFVCRGLV